MDYPLKREEKAVFELRALYQRYGYAQFKMSKFEEYDLYAHNKDFLVSDGVITFTDTDGRLMALKPDVTLSIIKNTRITPGCVKKVYYNENVYRISGSTHCFKEIMQTGLECIGDVSLYDLGEVVSLAMLSLDTISPDYILDLSHVGIIAALVDELKPEEAARAEILTCLAEKNADGLRALVPADRAGSLLALIESAGLAQDVIPAIEPWCRSDKARTAIAELKALVELLNRRGFGDRLRIDFSIANDMNYYNGVVFKGYINGLPGSVLSGGQYDELLSRMARSGHAVGFAIYLDMLERLEGPSRQYDVDVLLLYDEADDPYRVSQAVADLTARGLSVTAQRAIPEKLRTRYVYKVTKGGSETYDQYSTT